jgi:hypothetical protein
MAGYLKFVGTWVGLGVLVAAVFLLAFCIFMFLLGGGFSGGDMQGRVKALALVFLMALGFFAYILICLTTGFYVATQYGYGNIIGIVSGFALFAITYHGFSWIREIF